MDTKYEYAITELKSGLSGSVGAQVGKCRNPRTLNPRRITVNIFSGNQPQAMKGVNQECGSVSSRVVIKRPRSKFLRHVREIIRAEGGRIRPQDTRATQESTNELDQKRSNNAPNTCATRVEGGYVYSTGCWQ